MEQKKPNSPVILFVLAALFVVGAVALFLLISQVNQNTEAALAESLPEQVTIAGFDPAQHSNFQQEARVLAQLDLDMDYDVVAVTPDGAELPGRVIALLAEDAKPGDASLGSLIISQPLSDADYAWLQANKVADGAVGPVIALQGVISFDAAAWGPAVVALHEEQGRALAENPVLLEPFFVPREEYFALVPPSFFAALPGAVALLFGFFGVRQVGRRKRWAQSAGSAPGAVVVGAAMDAAGLPAFADTGQVLNASLLQPAAPVDEPLPVGPGGVMVTIPPYAPEMVDGSDGAVLMRKLLANSSGNGVAEVYSPEKPGLEAFRAMEQSA